MEKGDAEQALPLLEEAAQRFQQFQFAPFEGLFTVFLAESHRCTEQLESAHQLAKRALDTTTQARYGYGVGWAQRTLGRIAQARGDMMAVSTSLQAALETFTSIQVPFERGRTHLDLAALFHAQGQQETVAIHLSEAHSLFMTLNVPRYIELALKLSEAYGVTLSADRAG